MKKLISIIVPAHNAEKSITRTLDSIINQTYENIEVIVVNDSSSDNTLSVLKEASEKDSRICILDLPENKGVHEARMRGLRESKGQWIGFVDADDYIHPEMYETLLQNVIIHNADIGLCSVERVNEQGKRLQYLPKFRRNCVVDRNLLEDLTQFKFGAAYIWNRIYSRDIIIEAASKNFPWRQSLNEDLLINIGCFIKAKRIFLNSSVFYSYVDNPKSATTIAGNERAFVEHFRAFALALHFYGHISEQVQEAIYDVYKTQLAYGTMHIETTLVLDNYKKELQGAVDLINKNHPIAMAKMSSRNSKTNPSFKMRVFRLLRKQISKFLLKDKEFQFIK